MSRRVFAITTSVVADALRRKIIYVTILFAAIMVAAIPMLPSYGVGVVEGVYREVALTLCFVAGMVVALSLAANRIPSEVERRTIYNVLSRSVRRWEYVLGTWLGISVTLFGVFAVFGIVIFGLGWIVYLGPMWTLWQGVLAIWLEACVVAAFAIAVSTRGGAVVVATASLVFMFVTHARSGLFSSDQLAWKLYPSLDTFNIINPVAHGSGVGFSYLLTMILVFAAWAALLMLAGAFAFEGRDL